MSSEVYRSAYLYQKAISAVSGEWFEDGKFFIYKRDTTTPPPLGVVGINFYSEKKEIEIIISDERKINIGQDQFQLETFADNFIRLAPSYPADSTVRISADGRLNYSEVMNVLAVVKKAGFQNVSLVTAP